MNKELLLEGKKIIKELGKKPSLLSKWMAHYISELVEECKSSDKTEAAKAKELCSQLIVKLWEIKSKSDFIKIQQDLRGWYDKEKYCDEDKYLIVKNALENPEKFNENSGIELPLLISYLRDIESDLILIWLVAESQSTTDSTKIQYVAKKFHTSNEEIHTKKENLSKIFTAFKNVNLIEFENLRKIISKSLHRVYSLQGKLLGEAVDK